MISTLSNYLFPGLEDFAHQERGLASLIANQRRWMTISILTHGLFILMLIMSLAMGKGEDRFFAVSDDGRLYPVLPSSSKQTADIRAMSFAREVSMALLNYDFLDMGYVHKNLRSLFTQKGWDNYRTALDKAGITDDVKKERLVMRSVEAKLPDIIQRHDDGRLRLQGEVVTRILGPRIDSSHKMEVTVTLTPKPFANPHGYLVERIQVLRGWK